MLWLPRVTQNRGKKKTLRSSSTGRIDFPFIFWKTNFLLQIASQQLLWPTRISSMASYDRFLTLFPLFSVRNFWQMLQAHSQMDQSFINMESKYFAQAQICGFHTSTYFYVSFCHLEIILCLPSEAYRNWQLIRESSLVLQLKELSGGH